MDAREYCSNLLKQSIGHEPDSPDFKKHVNTFVSRVHETELQLLDLILALKEHLTSGVESNRSHGMAFLVAVASGMQSKLQENEVQVLGAFFVGKLDDWPSVSSAIKGCSILLQGSKVPESVVFSIGGAFLKDISVQQMRQAERAAALELLLLLIQKQGHVLCGKGLDLVQATINAIDGEKDPRCLMTAFECVQALTKLYKDGDVDSEAFISGSEDLFDVISCYFPVSFSRSPNDTHNIEKKDLSHALHSAMAASPHFAEHCIPLLLEKLSSSLRQAKMDALECLPLCCDSYGWQNMAEHISPLWSALKSDIIPKSGLESFKAQDDDSLRKEIGKCLQSCIFNLNKGVDAVNNEGFDDLILAEPCIQDLLNVLQIPENVDDMDHAETLVDNVAWLLSVVAASGGAACLKLFRRVLEPLLHLFESHKHEDMFLQISYTLLAQVVHALQTSAHKLGWKDPGIRDTLEHFHSTLQDSLSSTSCACGSTFPHKAYLAHKTVLELSMFPLDWEILSRALWLSDIFKVVGLSSSAASYPKQVGECAQNAVADIQELTSEALGCLVNGEREGDICIELVPFLLPSAHDVLFLEQPTLSILRSCSSSSHKFARAAILHIVCVLKELTWPKLFIEVAQERDLDSPSMMLDFVALELLPILGTFTTEDASRIGEFILIILQDISHDTSGIILPSTRMKCLARAINRLTAAAGVGHPDEHPKIALQLCTHLRGILEEPAAWDPQSLMIVLSCLVGLRSNLLDMEDSKACLDSCVCLLPRFETAREYVSTAIGCLINKMPQSEGFPDFALAFCKNTLFPLVAANRDCSFCLGIMLRSIGMRGRAHDVESEIVEEILNLNEAGTMGSGDSHEGHLGSLFELAIQEKGNPGYVCFLDETMHAKAGRLWRQRIFSMCLKRLLHALDLGVAEGWKQHRLLLALAYLLKGAGTGLVRFEAKPLFPRLLNILDILLSLTSLEDTTIVQSSLRLLGSYISDAELHDLCRKHFKDVLHTLLRSIEWQQSYLVRETGIQGLTDLVKVSEDQCKNHQRKVLSVMGESVDDNKRCIRVCAAKCRRLWLKI